MHVWHIGAESSRAAIGGVNFVVWTLAERQVAQGARVTLVVPEAPDADTLVAAQAKGIEVVHVPLRYTLFDGKALRAALVAGRPDVAVLHSVFLPRLIGASRVLKGADVPQVFMAHGALADKAMRRSALRKRLFVRLFEAPRIRRSGGVILCTPSEAQDIERVVPGYDGRVGVLYNPILLDDYRTATWNPPRGRPKALFIGRLDIEHKGIDRLFAMAARMPEMDFRLHGNADPRYEAEMRTLLAAAPSNLTVETPVFGADKVRAYAEATFVVQPSRWEGFPIINSEAMAVGAPVAISSDVPLSKVLEDQGCGMVLPADPDRAVDVLRAALADPARLRSISAAARRFAAAHFDPDRQAAAHLDLYRQVAADAHARSRAADPTHGEAPPALRAGGA
ncbi:glycosyltransferase family 4 protein [Novispirillum sp. DQ9]|uniref:glycosyltransferase family 4 protein n=1 Tax=Novispirillum sp. DQ9 TaxID=3398612 RepID=UPI003C7BD322